jgi:hypothetical protein
MCLFGCKNQYEFVNFSTLDRVNTTLHQRITANERRMEILEQMFKDTKEYKKAQCEVLKKYAKQG